MTFLEQLDSWVAGTSVHGDQCCPDFSCCQPDLLAPKEVREIFAAAHKRGDERVTMRCRMEFLGRAISKMGDKKVYVVGEVDL